MIKLKPTEIAITAVEKAIALNGTWCLDSRFIIRPHFESLESQSENAIRPVVKIPLLQEESAAVKTTKLIIAAADLMPTSAKTWTNGLAEAEKWVHG